MWVYFNQGTNINHSLLSYYLYAQKIWNSLEIFHRLTSPPSKARMKAQLSLVQERTVSVLPSLNRRVIEDSYVKLNLFWSCNQKMKK